MSDSLSHFLGYLSTCMKKENLDKQKLFMVLRAQFALLIFLETLCLHKEPANEG